MASTIQLKRGSGAPTSGDLAAGELGLDLTNNKIYSSTDGTDVVEMSPQGSVSFDNPTFTGVVEFEGYAPAVDYDFDGSGTLTSADYTAYGNLADGSTAVNITDFNTIEPSWSPLSGASYSDVKFRIGAVRGNKLDASAAYLGSTISGWGDTAVIGNVKRTGASTELIAGIGIDGATLRLISVASIAAETSLSVSGSVRPSVDNTYDLGAVSLRWDDVYATNGTIQTSDANEKQDIDTLSVAEQLVAARCKNLVRKFKWRSAVAEKGSEARTHFGVIAQDVKAAFEAEGLNASDYGVFIESTWTDDDGVEHTRLGVRYTELFAFIISAL